MDREVDPFAVFFPLDVVFFARSRALVLSFAIAAEVEGFERGSVAVERARRRSGGEGGNGRYCSMHRQRRLKLLNDRVADLWARTILAHPATGARPIRGEKGGARIKASLSTCPA